MYISTTSNYHGEIQATLCLLAISINFGQVIATWSLLNHSLNTILFGLNRHIYRKNCYVYYITWYGYGKENQ